MSNTERERILLLEQQSTNIMEKIDSIITRFDKFEEKLDNTFEKQNNRIEVLFTHKNVLYGAYAILVITAGIIIKLSLSSLDNKIDESVASALKEQAIVEYEN